MPAFRPLTEAELQRLPDDALIGYLRSAQAHADASAATALAILVYGHWRNVERRVALKVPAASVEDVTGEIVVSAIQSAFDGTSAGEFVVWLGTVTARRIADFHRRASARPKEAPLEPDAPFEAPDEGGLVETQDAIDRVLAGLRDDHRRVVELIVFQGSSAAEVPGTAEANAHQIVSRFRRALRRELGGDTG